MGKPSFRKKLVFIAIFLSIGFSLIPMTQGFGNKNIFYNLKTQINSNNDTLFDLKIKLLMILGHMPSLSVCIIKNNTIKWSKGYGFADRQHKIPATNKTVYMVASISKTFATTALLQLYEKGLIDLDTDVSKYLDFKLRNPKYPDKNITCRMLLAHRSSLTRYVIQLGIYFTFLGYPNEWLREFLTPSGRFYKSSIWNDYSPGEEFYYSDLGFEIIEYIVERITNQPFDEYCTENIIKPLNLSKTSYQLKDFYINEIARPYIWLGGIYFPLPQIQINNFAAGGLRTNVLDLSRFLLAHINNGTYNGIRILNENSTDMMHTLQFGNNFYGLGWFISSDWNGEIIGGHLGMILGGRAEMWCRPSDKTGIIFFWNQYEMFHLRNRPLENWAQIEIDKLLWEKIDDL